MMSASFPGHPGAMQHPGMPHGQPMPGQMPHPGQQMGHPMMQPGVSGPGPHVSQAGPMMAMQPGMGGPGGPNAQNHAMQHLAPGGQMLQHQSMMNNPVMMQQYQQQQQRALALQQHHARQQQQQQQLLQQQSMQMGLPNGVSQQQMAALQGGQFGGQINLPPHLAQQQQLAAMSQLRQQQHQQAQLAQQQAQAQAHAVAQAQAQQHQHQQQQAAQAAAAQQQHQANLAAQQQHHIQMQHANSQASNQGHATPQPGQQPAPNMPPNRPPTAMGNPHTAQPSPAPQPAQMPQPVQSSGPPAPQAPQPTVSAPQATPLQAPSGPQPSGSQGPQQANKAPQAGQQPPPQAPQQPPQNAQTQAIINAAQAQVMKTQGQQAQTQAQVAAPNQVPPGALQARLLAQREHSSLMRSNVLLKLFNFCDKLGSVRTDGQANSIEHWRSFVQQHFTEEGSFRMSLQPTEKGDGKQKGKQWEVGASSLARFFWTQYEDGVEQIQLLLEDVSERPVQNNCACVDAGRARMFYWFKDGAQVVWTGSLTAFYSDDRMETLHFDGQDHQQYFSRSKMEEMIALASPEQNKSPRMLKKQNPRAQQKQQQQTSFKLPALPVTDFGVTPKIQNFLELGETFAIMKDIMIYQQQNPKLGIQDSMNGLIQQYKQSNMLQQQQQLRQQGAQAGAGQMMPQQGMMQQQMQQMQQQGGSRTPGNFMSPAMQNQMLPGAQQMNGSPHIGPAGNPMMNNLQGSNTHTPSPAMSHMAPPMMPNPSQQGNGATASPQTGNANKRRRSTAVGMKEEGDDGTNGVKVKPSPRMGAGTVNKKMRAS